MLAQLGSRKGISTVVGMVLFIVLAIAVLAFMYVVLLKAVSGVEEAASLAKVKIFESELANQISSWWLLQGSTLEINVTNLAPQGVKISSIAVVLSNGSYVALYRGHTLGATYELVLPSGEVVRGALSMPFFLGSGYSVKILVNGFINATPVAVSASISASPGVAVLMIKNARYLHPTIVIRQVELVKPRVLHLESVAEPYTVSWMGRATLYAPVAVLGTPQVLRIEAEWYSGNATDLESVDGEVLTLESSPATAISIVQEPLSYTEFSTDPFASGSWQALSGSWSWGSSVGYVDGGIEQTSTSGSSSYGGEAIALLQRDVSSLSSFYIAYLVYVNNLNYYDTILYQSDSTFFTMGLNVAGNQADFEGWYYNGSWNSLCSSSAIPVTLDRWYVVSLYYSASNGQANVVYSLYDLNGNLLLRYSCSFSISESITRVGLGNWESTGRWDNFVLSLSNATRVVIENLPSGTQVVLLNSSSGSVIARVTPVNGVATVTVLPSLVLHNVLLEVVNASSNEVLAQREFSTLVGGEVLKYSSIWRALIEVSSSYPVEYELYKAFSMLYLESTSPINASLFVNTSSGLVSIASFTNVRSVAKNVSIPLSLAEGGSVTLLLEMTSVSEFNASIDALNVVTYQLKPETMDVLFVGIGGSNRIEVYRVVETTRGLSLSYLYSINASTFNGTTYFTYDTQSTELVLVNSSGVYERVVSPETSWKLVSSACRINVIGGQAQVIHVGGSSVLVVVNGSRMCLLNLSSGTLLYSTTLPYSAWNFSCSASNGTAAFIALGPREPVLAIVTWFGSSPRVRYLPMPTLKCVGAAWSTSLEKLFVLGDGGPLYELENESFIALGEVEPPYTPYGGDRLGIYAGSYVAWVRDDYTNEVWVWQLTTPS